MEHPKRKHRPNPSNLSCLEDAPDQATGKRLTVSELLPLPPARSRHRNKSVPNACERCRRRKIRCDGQVPCSTCRRFSVACVRLPKHKSESHAALEDRIQRLEAKIAEMKASQAGSTATNMGAHLPLLSVTETPSPPSLRLDTSLEFTPCSDSFDDLASASPNSAPPDIPMIQISPWDASSPIMLSPAMSSPCLTLLTPESCAGFPPMLGSELSPPTSTSPLSSPISASLEPTWHSTPQRDPREYHNLGDSNVRGLSRSILVSSFNSQDLESAGPPENEPQPLPSSCEQQFIEATRTVCDGSPMIPTRFEAETLSDIFFASVGSHDCPINRSSFPRCLDLVYPSCFNEQPASDEFRHLGTSYSSRMAKFHVYMVMAIATRMKGYDGSIDTNVLDNFYQLAIQQTTSYRFWEEPGAVEAALLIALFSMTSSS
ncbi:putative c6 zinc finger domain protein [Lipomyces tetrasporus]|uniref:C6 zinc finger domain protein n=1 Tax=Lipomyces tetrasporus TaxID=54092 RepID=A0AAD7QKX8_9ASCO|nr:putative c6 zinc finger domain protein [Lipomyces tetrasporus]KAJ8097182.1 putative c6 zinc finger domain protein [Lipomyces tetrasporus]